MKERLQKILSAQGICSRRKAEEYIKEGAVKVNGITALLGESADPEVDEITLNGVLINEKTGAAEEKTYIMLNKPRGYVTTLADESGRRTVLDLVGDIPVRIYPVGRLDMHSEGLLLMTNDGELTNKLTHPKHKVYKTYLLNIIYDDGKPAVPAEQMLQKPMTIDGIRLAPAKCRKITDLEDGCILTISIREGKNRQIRRMCTQCGFTVRSLKRVSIGKLMLADLPTGEYRHLTAEEVDYLKSL
ncbi:MAG: rRNA pseudouridine synthase [Clostridia bacterium]|nr:rRNA pseudouridine synthase [Clostridia bacterium]MBQ3092216.1 rRNA pseudouridine synthase [Clostridia bacterium]